MVISIIDYAISYFKYKTIIPIRGELINKSLKRLKLELQANANSIEIDLERENYGYLGLVLIDKEYIIILNN